SQTSTPSRFDFKIDLINDEIFSLCKRGVKLINVARGEIIDEKSLVNALNCGQCGGTALDVFEKEPPIDMKLIQHPLTICTPHFGASTREAQKRVAIDLVQQIIDFKEHSLIGVANGSAVTSQFGQENRSILLLCKRLGQIIGASSTTIPTEISLSLNHDNQIKELSGIISGDHSWLNSVNQCRFIAHVPLDDENSHVFFRPIKGSFMDYLRDNTSQFSNRISTVFDTTTPTGNIQDQRWCAILL
ncbi:unnamed protein product, partial [Rotaria magnacalcarata]